MKTYPCILDHPVKPAVTLHLTMAQIQQVSDCQGDIEVFPPAVTPPVITWVYTYRITCKTPTGAWWVAVGMTADQLDAMGATLRADLDAGQTRYWYGDDGSQYTGSKNIHPRKQEEVTA